MSNSTTNLDLISVNQAQKEVTANGLFDAGSPATVYGRRASTSGGLVWGYYGGAVMVGGVPTQIANGTLTLAASATNYLEADPASGAVSANTTGFTAGRTRLYTVVTNTASVTSFTDQRVGVLSAGAGVTSINGHTGAVTLAASDVGADASGAATAAVAAHAAATDPHPQYLTQSEGDARYAASGAAGVTSVNGHTGAVTLAAVDVGALATTSLGAANGAAQLGADQKLLPAQLPDLAIIIYLGTVASQAAMLALTGQQGDWCIRSDDAKVYVITGSNPASAGSWTALSYPVGTSGTVTSVGLSTPGVLFDVSGTPVTGSGTLSLSLKTQGANKVLAGPTSGADAAPTMRALTPADLPVMGPSGASHAAGIVPDPGSTAGTTKYLREDGSWQVPPGTTSASTADAQVFSASGTWTKPAGCTFVRVICVGAGGGGGGGDGGAAGAARAGGSGGGGGCYVERVFKASDLSATESVVVGAGGTGGSGGSSAGGSNGGAGGNSSFGAYLTAFGGGQGGGGSTGNLSGGAGAGTGAAGGNGSASSVAGGFPASTVNAIGTGGAGGGCAAGGNGQCAEFGGAAGGGSQVGGTGAGLGGSAIAGGPGGGGGGSITAANAGGAGSAGGSNGTGTPGGGGVGGTGAAGAAGTAGTAGNTTKCGTGGGGGASNTAGTGGNGGAGGAIGAGGGGGGAGTSTGGTGGAGGRGEVRIYSW